MKEKEDSETYRPLIILFIILTLLWGASTWWIQTHFGTWQDRGTFGDSFGAVNALFSGLALAGIIFTIILQKNELSLQREEIKATREEFITQNATLKFQRFENTFFHLISLHHQIVDGIDLVIDRKKKRVLKQDSGAREFIFSSPIGSSTKEFDEYEPITLKGRDVFEYRFWDLRQLMGSPTNTDTIEENYMSLYQETVQSDFGHYFRNLYRILKFVDETEFYTHHELGISPQSLAYADSLTYSLKNFETRYKYTSIIRSQLSDFELLWLFYNCLSPNGIDKFKRLLENYSILKNMPIGLLHDPDERNRYNVKAFERQH